LLVFSGHRKGVKCAVWCSASKSMASPGVDRQVVIWEPETGDVLARLHGQKKTITNLQYRFHDQRDILISLDRRSDLKVWDPTNFVKLVQIGGVVGDLSVGSMAVLDDYILMFDRRPQIWKFKKG
jgi:WD40 repeat protein